MKKGVILAAIGCVLLIAALVVNSNLNEKDSRREEVNTAVGDFGGALTGRYEYKETRKSDRLPVYALGVTGAIFIGLGVVCWAIEGKQRP